MFAAEELQGRISANSEWNEPIPLEYELHTGARRRRIVARMGYPQHAEKNEWRCAAQVIGLDFDPRALSDGRIHRLGGSNGLEAMMQASLAIRAQLDRLKQVRWRGVPYELAFPRVLPTCYWSNIHHRAARIINSELEKSGVKKAELIKVERLDDKTLGKPWLVDHKFRFQGRSRPVVVRMGYPLFVDNRQWGCVFQIVGLSDGSIQRAYGDNPLLAAANAARLILMSLPRLKVLGSMAPRPELVFPSYLPTHCGLALHRRLRKMLDAEIKRWHEDEDRHWNRGAAEREKILRSLPPAARL